MKPLLLKTYGKQKRKLSAWISPENRKRVFDSTASSDGDNSVFERPRPTKTRRVSKASVASSRAGRLAKQKAMQSLTEKSFDDENIIKTLNVIIPCPPHPPPVQESKTRRRKKINVCSGRTVRPARRKTECLTMNSSDEENIGRPSPLHPQQSKITSVHPPSVGRFVTRRRRAAATKAQHPKSRVVMLNSSGDFSSGALCSSRILRPSRRSRVPPTITVSSAENSMNAAGTSSLATNPLREVSLNESSDHSLGLSSRKPIFCSTPSANPFTKHPRLKPYHINDQSSAPLSMSVSCIGVLSPFQQDVDSPQQPITPCHSARPIGLPFEEKPQSSLGKQQPDLHHLEEPSGDLFMEAKSANRRISSSEHAKSHSEDIKTKSGEKSPDTVPRSDSDSSSYFVSAATGLEWLIEDLKEECLTKHCRVQLVRDIFTVIQLCNQTTYSSCLEAEQSIHHQQTNEHSVSVNSGQTVDHLQSSEASFNLHLSATNNKNSAYFVSVNSFGSSEQAVSVTDSLSCNNSSSAHCKLSAEFSSTREFMEQSSSVLHGESNPHTNSRDEFIVNTQLPANSSSQSVFTKEDMQHATKMSEDDSTHNMGNPGDLVSVKWSIHNSSELAQTQCNDAETKEQLLKKKCLTKKLYVDVKRVNLSELKEIVKLKDAFKSPTVVSDLPSDDQMNSDHQSEQDTNHCHKDTFSMKANMRKRSSTSSEDKISIDKETVKRSCDILPKRKKMSVAPKEKKRRSASTDRPGTTRKACVSGLSVNRWKNKCSANTYMFRSQTAKSGSIKAMDSSINELISTQHKRPTVLGAIVNFSTPVKATPHNLSSLLADITPNTNTWSRLKAAISVHRKVLLTPSTPVVSKNPRMANLADISQDLFGTPSQTPLSKHLRSQLLRPDSLAVWEDVDLSDAEKVYAECGQQHPLPWKECILPQRMKQCVKIGEGTFGEVFSTTSASGDTVALKIIPVEGSKKVNGEDQKTLGEILHEIIISKELSSLKEKQQNKTHGFIGLNDLHCVQGCYPPDFLKAWDRFDQKKGSENDRPDFFENDQLFIVLEFEFGGIDLENSNGTLASLGVGKSILHQVTAALAVAEQELHFEHRDLHWGNILVKTTKEKTGSFLLNGKAHFLETEGVLVRIIDYSLSRLEIDELTVSCDISKDEELFMGQGDYQFEIYRLMRKENGNNWSDYHPHTNVLWLHYVCSKLLSMKYQGSRGRGAKGLRQELTHFYDNILQYSSATDVLQNCPMFQ